MNLGLGLSLTMAPLAFRRIAILIAGQSNAAASNADYDPLIDTTDPRIRMLSAGIASVNYTPSADGTVMLAQDPLQAKYGLGTTTQRVTFAMAFAKNYLLEHPNTEILLVQTAVGGTGFSVPGYGNPNLVWNWDQNPAELTTRDKTLYQNLVDQTNAAKALGYEIGGLLWHQGEYNGYTPPVNEVYTAEFPAMVQHWRDDCCGGALVPVVVGTVNHATNIDPLAVHQLNRINLYYDQINIASYVPRCACVDNASFVEDIVTPNYTLTNDGTHFLASFHRGNDGKSGMGKRYYDAFKTLAAPTYSGGTLNTVAPTLVGSPPLAGSGPLTGDGTVRTFDATSTQYSYIPLSGITQGFGMSMCGFIKYTRDGFAEALAAWATLATTGARLTVYNNDTIGQATNINAVGMTATAVTDGPIIPSGSWVPWFFVTDTWRGLNRAILYTPYGRAVWTSASALVSGMDIALFGRIRGGNNNASSLAGAVAHIALFDTAHPLNAESRHALTHATSAADYQSKVAALGASKYASMLT